MKKKKEEKDDVVGLQPVLNIGMIGHVDHGKTTLTEALSGKWTDTHSEEMKRGITIRLGYANISLRKCTSCPEPECFTVKEICETCGKETHILRRISLVDAPGHESLMATMLAGATIMNGALLLVSATEECPQPQTKEHLVALEIMGVKNVIIVQNKIDLVDEARALKNYQQIKEFVKNTLYKDAPIIPISAQRKINIDALIKTIQEIIPTPEVDLSKDPLMLVARSFDVNKPGTPLADLTGGILGGTVVRGTFKLGDSVEIKPGRIVEERNKKVAKPLKSTIVGLMTGTETVESIRPGGSVAIATALDPSIVKSDKLTGAVVGLPGKLPKVWYQLKLEPHLLERVVGMKDELKVEPVKIGENLMLNVNSAATVGIVTKLSKELFDCTLKLPVCADVGARVTISRIIGSRFRLIGYGVIKE
ncbi:translation initiation factor IF-2 subunit gamma [Candidatus Woesearchaeota archaeon]|nr:translation initiation factor IF-2 subunit gamma [Candidatus Woesearchaeota archaeon]